MPAGKNTYDDEIKAALDEATQQAYDAANQPMPDDVQQALNSKYASGAGQLPVGKYMAQPVPGGEYTDSPDETYDLLYRARRDQLGMHAPTTGTVLPKYFPGGKYKT